MQVTKGKHQVQLFGKKADNEHTNLLLSSLQAFKLFPEPAIRNSVRARLKKLSSMQMGQKNWKLENVII
jgi:hypothetical protein